MREIKPGNVNCLPLIRQGFVFGTLVLGISLTNAPCRLHVGIELHNFCVLIGHIMKNTRKLVYIAQQRH